MPHKVDSPARTRSSTGSRRARPIPLLHVNHTRGKTRKILESAIRRLQNYGTLKTPGPRRMKALIVACAYMNRSESAASPLAVPASDPPAAAATLLDTSTIVMTDDVEMQSKETLEVSLLAEKPVPRGKTVGSLRHSHKDGQSLRDLLRDTYKFSDIEYLSDDGHHTEPTANNIRAAMDRLMDGAQPGDTLVFAFIGHGGQRVNEDGTERDGLDEIIYGVDEDEEQSMIVDDEINDRLVKRLPKGCKLTAIFDACHSGTAMDLIFANCYPNSAYRERRPGESSQAAPAGGDDSEVELSPVEERMDEIVPALKKAVAFKWRGKSLFRRISEMRRVSKAKIFSLSACRDHEVTYEWKRGYTLTQFVVETIGRHKKGFIAQRKLLAKITRLFDKVYSIRPDVDRATPQLGSNSRKVTWKREPFIAGI